MISKNHLFALWHPTLSAELHIKSTEITIKDKELISRIIHILRLTAGEQCILFDATKQITATIVMITSKIITMTYTMVSYNQPYTPTITALLPLLKKDDLSTAVTQLTAIGISKIQLIMTEKVQRSWGGTAEYERLQRVIIAAAEQSKNFALPVLVEPIPLREAITGHAAIICGDPDGTPYQTILSNLPASLDACAILVGPEGDFTDHEKEYLKKADVQFCSLTPTILRSHLAITVLATSLRSWYHTP